MDVGNGYLDLICGSIEKRFVHDDLLIYGIFYVLCRSQRDNSVIRKIGYSAR